MEQHTTEEKIAAIHKRFEEIDSSGVGKIDSSGIGNSTASGNGSSESGGPRQPSTPDGNGLYVAPEFKKGKIAAMKRELSAKLEIDATPDTTDNDGVAGVDDQRQIGSGGNPGAGLFVAPEFKKGKISAMKESLVSRGLGIDGAATTGAGQEDSSGNALEGDGMFKAPEFEKGKISAMKQELSSKGLGLDCARAAAAGGEGAGDAATPAAPVELCGLVERKDAGEPSAAPFSEPNASMSASPAGAETAGAETPLSIPKETTKAAGDGDQARIIPVANGNSKTPVDTEEKTGRPEAPAQPARGSSSRPAERPSPTPDRHPVTSGPRPASPLRSRERSATGRSTQPASARRRTPSPAVTRDVGDPQLGRQPSPARRKKVDSPSSNRRPAVGSLAATARGRRQTVSGYRPDKSTFAEQRASPANGQVSRGAASTPGYAESLVAGPGAVAESRRRSSTPSRPRGSPVIQQQMSTPVRPIVMGAGSPAMGTPSSAEQAGARLYDQARATLERMERRRQEGNSPAVSADGLSPFTPRRWSNPRRGNPSLAGMERVERLYRHAVERDTKLEMARREEDENPRYCTFTPKITARASSRGRTEKRGRREGVTNEGMKETGGRGSGGNSSAAMSRFHALYLDAELRREKMEARTDARRVEVAGPGSPVITALGRKQSGEPLDVRLKENAERWVRRFKELEEKKAERDTEGCTFQPTLKVARSASAPRLRGGGRDDSSTGSGRSEPFVVRAEKYLVAREKRLAELKRDFELKELAEVTFQPKMTAAFVADNTAAGDIEGDIGQRGNKGGGSRDSGVFERLLRAATEQEIHKAALKEEFLQKEREEFQGFQPRIPTKRSSSPARPLDARLRESTEHWVQSREAREKQRLEQEALQCTFRPSVGGGGGAALAAAGSPVRSADRRMRRSSSADPRSRANTGRATGPGAAAAAMAAAEAAASAVAGVTNKRSSTGAFEARSKAFQEARDQRLNKLRDEKMRHELQEATFHPIIGFGAEVSKHQRRVRTSSGGGSAAADMGIASAAGAAAASELAAEASMGIKHQNLTQVRSNGQGADMIAAAPKSDAGTAEKEAASKAQDESVNFKPQTNGRGSSASSASKPQNPLLQQQRMVKETASSREDTGSNSSGQQGPSSLSSPHKARPKSEAADGVVGHVATPQQQACSRVGRNPEAGTKSGGWPTTTGKAVAAPPAAVVPTGGASDGITMPKKKGAERGVGSAKPSNGASGGGGKRDLGDDDVKTKADQGVDVDELSARLQQLAEDKNDHSEEDLATKSDPKPRERKQDKQQQQQQPVDGKVDIVSPPSLVPTSSLPLAAKGTDGAAAEASAKDVNVGRDGVGQATSQDKAAAIHTDSRVSPGAEDSEAESVPEPISEPSPVTPRLEMEQEQGEENEEEEYEAHNGAEEEEEEEEEENGDYYDDDEETESEDGGFAYSNPGGGGRMADQTTRSLEDFDQVQREIEAKLRAL